MKFKQQTNKVHPSIKFDFNFSIDSVVYKTQSGKLETKLCRKLETKLYRKESNPQAYLHRKSEHTLSL